MDFFIRIFLIFVIDFFMIKTIASKGFTDFLLTLEHYFNISLEKNKIESLATYFSGNYKIYFLLIFIALLLWFFNNKKILDIYIYIYLFWLTIKFLLATLFLIFGLWNPTANAFQYLINGCLTWITNLLIFANYYWLIDSENQKLFIQDKNTEINFLFFPTISDLPRYRNWVPFFLIIYF